jgi:hypothetical protein
MAVLDFPGAQAPPAGVTLLSSMPTQVQSWGRTILEVVGFGALFVLLITMAGLVLWMFALLASRLL